MKLYGGLTLFSEIAAIIPAAGRGKRFGIPKAQAALHGRSFLDLITDTLHEAGIRDVIAVTDVDTADMLASIRIGIDQANERLPKGSGYLGYLIFPVDHPLVNSDTVIALCQRFMDDPQVVVKPCYQGKYGHPVIIPAALDLNCPTEHGLSQIISDSAYPVIALETDDPNVVLNLNTPSDIPG